ncbi:MAG: DUF1353 domain-containing protein [Patescibacteria group bacterium]|nr:DUF1353 domain-containing protein [Patescibacteria group bacterium]
MLVTPTGFQQKTLDVRTGNGLDDVLLEPLIYRSSDGRLFRAPVGSTTDGLSIPKVFQNIPGFSPAGGIDWFCGVLHDSAYRDFLEIWNGTDWMKASLDRSACDWLILDAMEAQGVGIIRRHTIYAALRIGGGTAFMEDRKQHPAK